MQNTYTVQLHDGREICFSYGVPVAAFIPGTGYIKTDKRYSVTTSRHANAYVGPDYLTVTDQDLRTAILPIYKGSR